MCVQKLGIALAITLLCGCASTEVARLSNAVSYNGDSRQEAYESPQWSSVLAAVAIHVPTTDVIALPGGGFTISSRYTTHGANEELCAGQRFAAQPIAWGCSGTLVAPDLVVSAGHCDETFPCATTSWVFDFAYQSAGQLARIDANDVYRCQARVAHTYVDDGLDYTLYRLERPVVGRMPVAMRTTPAPAVGENVLLAGFPDGLPLKTDLGRITRVRSVIFKATVDAFHGNSGSGVYAPSGALLGVLARGNEDYVRQGNCNVLNNISCTGACIDGEDIVRWSSVLADICRQAPSSVLCVPAPVDAGTPIVDSGLAMDAQPTVDTGVPPAVDAAATGDVRIDTTDGLQDARVVGDAARPYDPRPPMLAEAGLTPGNVEALQGGCAVRRTRSGALFVLSMAYLLLCSVRRYWR